MEAHNDERIYYPPGGILIWMILSIELLTFIPALIIFFAYMNADLGTFMDSVQTLDLTLGTVNTVLLIVGGWFVAEGIRNLRLDRRERSSLLLWLGVLTGLGFELRELTREERRRLKANGVKVISIYRGSRIERTNMDPGFIITKIDNKPVESVDALVEEFSKATGKVMLEGIYESYPGEYYYAFPID